MKFLMEHFVLVALLATLLVLLAVSMWCRHLKRHQEVSTSNPRPPAFWEALKAYNETPESVAMSALRQRLETWCKPIGSVGIASGFVFAISACALQWGVLRLTAPEVHLIEWILGVALAVMIVLASIYFWLEGRIFSRCTLPRRDFISQLEIEHQVAQSKAA